MSASEDLQLSIPTTGTAGSPKSHVVYNIHIALPLRSYVLSKRYSEFADLHSSLLATTGVAPPAPLPPKHFIASTIQSSSLIEQRRVGLELYLLSIRDHEDNGWRSCPEWRQFLGLPVYKKPSGFINKGIGTPQEWNDVLRETKQLLQITRTHLIRRTEASSVSESHSESAGAKRALVSAGIKISNMASSLETMEVPEGEKRRRRDLVEVLKQERDGLEILSMNIKSQSPSLDRSPPHARNMKSPTRRVFGAIKETEKTRQLDNSGLLQLQTEIMSDQDSHLLEFERILARQKELGQAINQELSSQHQLLSETDTDLDRTQTRLKIATKHVERLKQGNN
ncbi:Vacuolar morphogenesis protein 7 [Neolecta irregularis DAH-3]|uniref:Vacuolar morphogenesis protein 7 n=1 Tax=Neolecta irregularis (strain DAH-3) TaxID=1198029 RepID=A0A1U7LLM1_NEOID|nr:Vacuolar morphogenesis protein 7 [Neolecta irregularis DAH-3]|eukprot:OLL23547.1 Vacuolar morphogenesis protein 7 [Neolecta irregularis DAH-3]